MYERKTGRKVTKSNFLVVYGAAHIRALMEVNILSAFHKTGVIPLNRDVISADAMAPSLETTTQITALPFVLSPSVQAITERLMCHAEAPSGSAHEPINPQAGSSMFVGSYDDR